MRSELARNQPPGHTRKPPELRGFSLFVVRDTGIEPVTSSVSGKRATAAPIAPKKGYSVVMRGGDGIRTRVNGFAGRCLAARPRHRVWFDPRVVIALESGDPRTRADDETRTRDPHLGKVMRYQLRYIRISFPVLPGHLENSSPFRAPRKTTATPRVSRSHGSNHPHGSGNIGTRPGRVAAPGAEGDWRSW